MAEYHFSLSGVALPEADNLFGVWTVPTAPPPQPSPALHERVSFGVSTPAEPTWHVSLPASPEHAQSILDAQKEAIQRSDLALTQAQQRLAQLQSDKGVSFAMSGSAGPEASLLATLNALESPVSFGLQMREDAEQQKAHTQWKTFLEQIQQMVAHAARVETEIGGSLVGHTAVGWTGDFDTLWTPGVTRDSMQLHHRAVHLALASRVALMRMVAVVGTGAAGLALRLTIPGAQLLVLPAAWRFVQDVLREWRNYQQSTN